MSKRQAKTIFMFKGFICPNIHSNFDKSTLIDEASFTIMPEWATGHTLQKKMKAQKRQNSILNSRNQTLLVLVLVS